MQRAVPVGLVVVLFLSILPLAGASDVDSQAVRKAGSLYSKGERALKSGDAGKAKDLFQRAVQALPEFPQAHLGLGHIAMNEERFEDALGEYQKARDGYPKIGEALLDVQARRYADSQRQINELQDSINQIRGGGAGSSSQQDVEFRVAQIENAISRLQAIQPPDKGAQGEVPAEVWFYIGNAQFRLGRVKEAMDSWAVCARTDTEFAMVHNNLAIALAQSGDIDKAREHLNKAEQLGFVVNPQFKADLEGAGGS